MFEWIANSEAWIALGTLAALEIVLGIDNILFISILVGRLPRGRGRYKPAELHYVCTYACLTLIAIAWTTARKS